MYWNGTSWEREPAAPPPRRRYGPRLFGATAEAILITSLVFGLVAGTTFAAKGGNGKGNRSSAASCVVDGSVVHGSSLPIWELMNFMVTDASGTTGWAIGYTDTGERSINVPERRGPTVYEFTGRTYGSDGSRYDVYASCSAG